MPAQSSPLRQFLDGEFIFVAGDEIERRAGFHAFFRLDRHLGADKADLGGGIDGADHGRGLAIRLEAGRRGVNDDQLMRLHVFLDVLEGKIVRRRVDQARARHHRRGLGQPGGKPEALDLALHLVARAGAAVIAVEGRGLEEKRLHHLRGLNRFRLVTIAPPGSTERRAPRQCTVSPNRDATNTAKLRRSRTGNSQAGPAWVAKIPSMRYLRNSRAPSAIASTARLGRPEIQQNRGHQGQREAQM